MFSSEPCENVDIILIQESRHEVLSPGWVIKLADDHTGFGVACSEVPAKDSIEQSASWWYNVVLEQEFGSCFDPPCM